MSVVDASVSIPNFGAPALTLADFSGVTLTPGQKYTLVASSINHVYPPTGSYSDLGIVYNSLSGDSLGSFYYTGSPLDPSYFTGRTIAFQVEGVAGIPEPATWTLMMVGIGGIGAATRSRRDRARASA